MTKQSKTSSKSASRPVSAARQRKRDQSLSPKSAKMMDELAKLRVAGYKTNRQPAPSVPR